MRKIIERNITVLETESIVCDVCGTEYKQDDQNNWIETQEFLHIDFVGGYGSVFGDTNRVKCDVCQTCLKELLGKYLKIETQETEIV